MPDGQASACLVLADVRFPYSPPRIALAEPPDRLTWPHVEKDGLLCLHRPEQEVPREKPIEVLEWVFGKARKLIVENRRGNNMAAFRNEFTSYWSIAVGENGDTTEFVSLVVPEGPSRTVVLWRGLSGGVVAEDNTALTKWLKRVRGSDGDRPGIQSQRAALLWMPEPLTPAEYPQTGWDVRTLAGRLPDEATTVLKDLAVLQPDEVPVLLAMPAENGVACGLVRVEHPKRSHRLGRSGNPVSAGFRKDRVPKHVVYDRYFASGTKAHKAVVERADHTWVHGRDQDPNQQTLRRKRAAVVGCGSLGGPVAVRLAQVGVGSVLLVDPDQMRWPNVSRHTLGAQAVGKNKAEALAETIRSEYPHLGEISAHKGDLNCSAQALLHELALCDVILEATANWAASNLMNDLQSGLLQTVPVVYAWMEAEALAAHALTLRGSGGCLRCGFSQEGIACVAVTDWPEGPRTLTEPTCGATFTPYGAVELAWAHALVLEALVDTLLENEIIDNHRVWVGSRRRIESAGAAVSEDWRTLMGDPGVGNICTSRRWPAAEGCPVCAQRTRAGAG